ncbi:MULTISPECIES: YiiX/YebB-like N1pC/P60 family cysteine hydrolase [unclassified Stenotrophomonas]|uniref:YiiX/YebB-like N1pC/P60 family cysteine hydrolase n=1 Tax=unclassified Stenotrophomonas TaxID=196198 RepID=UPI003BF8E7D8
MRAFLLALSLLAPTLWPGVVAALEVREGDLLFVTAGRSGLSAAIDDATGKQHGPSFDHVALVASASQGWEVLHADEKGSRRQSLVEFRQDARARQRQIAQHWVDLYRGMGMDVPQDQPGTNPNDMSAAPVLQRIGVLE